MLKTILIVVLIAQMDSPLYQQRETSYISLSKLPISITMPLLEDALNNPKCSSEVQARAMKLMRANQDYYVKTKIDFLKKKFVLLPRYEHLVAVGSAHPISWCEDMNKRYYEFAQKQHGIDKDHWNGFSELSPYHWQRICTEMWLADQIWVSHYKEEELMDDLNKAATEEATILAYKIVGNESYSFYGTTAIGPSVNAILRVVTGR